VTDSDNVRRAAKYVSKTYGSLDVLVNNAGIIGKHPKSLKEGDVDQAKRIMETNYYGPMRMSAAFIPLLKKSKDARIINVSSGMGALNDLFGSYAAYRLSKAGLNAQTILLSNDLIGDGIKVFAMCPGWVRTEMGGAEAHRSVEQGADTAIWLASAQDAETGKFYRDRAVIPW
jgi:NAD(P)-dependent dehydrogenase (short-subunit alcohol dehydrogenase family)